MRLDNSVYPEFLLFLQWTNYYSCICVILDSVHIYQSFPIMKIPVERWEKKENSSERLREKRKFQWNVERKRKILAKRWEKKENSSETLREKGKFRRNVKRKWKISVKRWEKKENSSKTLREKTFQWNVERKWNVARNWSWTKIAVFS